MTTKQETNERVLEALGELKGFATTKEVAVRAGLTDTGARRALVRLAELGQVRVSRPAHASRAAIWAKVDS